MPCQTNFTSVFRFEEHRKSKEHAEKAGEDWQDPGRKAAETPAAAGASTSESTDTSKEGDAGGNGQWHSLRYRSQVSTAPFPVSLHFCCGCLPFRLLSNIKQCPCSLPVISSGAASRNVKHGDDHLNTCLSLSSRSPWGGGRERDGGGSPEETLHGDREEGDPKQERHADGLLLHALPGRLQLGADDAVARGRQEAPDEPDQKARRGFRWLR